jgi:hypothetical protein
MKSIFTIIVCLISLIASAGVYDTLGFKVNVPKISKVDDRAVVIEITFDSSNQKLKPRTSQRNIKPGTLANMSDKKIIVQIRSYNNVESNGRFNNDDKLPRTSISEVELFTLTAGSCRVVSSNKELKKKLTG